MSRHGYIEDYGDTSWAQVAWRGAVQRAIDGRRGQAIMREMADAMDALPDDDRQLVRESFQNEQRLVCALGVVGRARGIDMSKIDPEDAITTAKVFGIAERLAREITWINDEDGGGDCEEPEDRFDNVRAWLRWNIKPLHVLVTSDRDF